ncbi:MAG: class I SAM-dependent RNA methyltransferase [bacterium]|nr:class I SAM-dependent RNA methyltransferase [bacterium]
MQLNLVATCALGLEAVVARELQRLGIGNIKSHNGYVSFSGDTGTLCRANIWLRSADRVWLCLSEFACETFEDLFQGVKQLPWPLLLPREACFPVDALTHNSRLTSLPALQRTAKKAVVEVMQSHYRLRELPETGALYPIRIFLVNDVCRVMLDTSGSGLHRRGYRTLNAAAPLRETLAAALLQLSYWNKDRLLLDPFCGSGTIPIEAAFIGLNRAPGLKRSFCSERWPFVKSSVWRSAREEAEDLFDRKSKLQIIGRDIDGRVLKLAQFHLKQADLPENAVVFQREDVRSLRSRQQYGVIVTNPPYGERVMEREEAEEIYAVMGEVLAPLRTWSIYAISSNPDFEYFFGRKAERRRKVYNGMMQCTYYQYPGPKPPER